MYVFNMYVVFDKLPLGFLCFFPGGLMFFPWLFPLEGWHSTATSAQPVLQLTRGGGGGCGLFFYLISVSTRASV